MNLTLFVTLMPLLFVMQFCGFSRGANAKIVSENALTIAENPEFLPEEFPRSFRYPGASIKNSALYNGAEGMPAEEAIAIFLTKDSIKEIDGYYQKTMNTHGWNIIQSHHYDSEFVLVAESYGIEYKRLATIIARTENQSVIKIYIKRSEG